MNLSSEPNRRRSRPSNPPHRRGVAVVEFAVCLPVIMILILGSIEATNAVFLKQALTTAAYEGIREAVRNSSDQSLANLRANDVLTARNVRGSSVSFIPANIDSVARGELVQIEVAAPLGQNSPFIGRVITDRSIRVRSTMVKE